MALEWRPSNSLELALYAQLFRSWKSKKSSLKVKQMRWDPSCLDLDPSWSVLTYMTYMKLLTCLKILKILKICTRPLRPVRSPAWFWSFFENEAFFHFLQIRLSQAGSETEIFLQSLWKRQNLWNLWNLWLLAFQRFGFVGAKALHFHISDDLAGPRAAECGALNFSSAKSAASQRRRSKSFCFGPLKSLVMNQNIGCTSLQNIYLSLMCETRPCILTTNWHAFLLQSKLPKWWPRSGPVVGKIT